MESKPTISEFEALLYKMKELHIIKSHDYDGSKPTFSNYRTAERVGVEPWVAASLRLVEKLSRLETFCVQREFKVKEDDMENTMLDIANISLIVLILWREQNPSIQNDNTDIRNSLDVSTLSLKQRGSIGGAENRTDR